MHIRVDDTVEVITGDDRGTRGKVLRVLRAPSSKLVVEGVNRVYRHVRRSQRNPQGGRLSKEMPISLVERAVGLHRLRQADAAPAPGCAADGGKDRYCKKCRPAIGVIVAARKARRAAK